MKLQELIDHLNTIFLNEGGELEVCIWDERHETHLGLTNVMTEQKVVPRYRNDSQQIQPLIVSLD